MGIVLVSQWVLIRVDGGLYELICMLFAKEASRVYEVSPKP